MNIKITENDFGTINTINGLELTLRGGEVYFLDQFDLEYLLNFTNLNFNGNTAVNVLPEGAYIVSFEATDFRNPTIVVSNVATDFAQCMVMHNDPSMLSFPADGSELPGGGDATMFSWMPRSVISVPGQQVMYRFKIVEVIPVERNPNEAIQSTAYSSKFGQSFQFFSDTCSSFSRTV